MATKLVVNGKDIRGVYDDKYRALYENLGALKVTRASNVEFEDGDWVARLPDGTEIARGKDRGQAIKDEVSYLEARL